MTDRRFIEESFPVKEVSDASAREKSIRHGHISTLHAWWARRPLAASRATAYAALIPPAEDELSWQKSRDFVVELSNWDSSLNELILRKARQDVLEAHAKRLTTERGAPVAVEDIEAGRAPRPRVLDPFAGGGAIPLEALRLGCETWASDCNPVAVLLLKATLEYPQRFGRSVSQQEQTSFFGETVTREQLVNPLLRAVKRWGDWVLREAHQELASYYPREQDGLVPVAFIWARTIPCQNPVCGVSIPLLRRFWLAQKDGKEVALYPEPTPGALKWRIVGDGYEAWPADFDPDRGTIARAVVTCPVCGGVVDDKTTRKLFREGTASQRMVAVVLADPVRQGKSYRLPGPDDLRVYHQAEATLAKKRDELMMAWGLDPVPDEELPLMSGTFNVPLYGMTTWGSLFNSREQLSLITFAQKLREAHVRIALEERSEEFARAVITYLALNLDRLASYCSSTGYWHVSGEKVSPAMQRQALAMVFDYAESNPFAPSFSWQTNLDWILRVIEHLSLIREVAPVVSVRQASATQLPYPTNHFDAVLTDPPYYNSVPYADLSDFFYVWLKRSLGALQPELFTTPLVPKEKEIVEMAGWDPRRYAHKDRAFFEARLGEAFREMHRVLKPDGICMIVYTHKSTAGWETVINALLDSGLVLSGAWPIDTEMETRLRAHKSAALASSIYMVARKSRRQPTGFYNEVREELRRHLNAKLHRLWEEGIGGADFFIAAIGSAVEVFGRYEQVIDFEGRVVRAARLLEDVRTMATDYAVRQILQNGFAGEVSDLTRFYVLWRWEFGDEQVAFDEARKLAQSCGLDLAREWGRGGFVRKEKEFIRVIGPQRRDLEALEDSHELIDVLHRVLLLWEKGRRAEIVQILSFTGFGQSEAFYRVAQAVSETLPNDSKEKKLLDGFLAGRARVRDDVDKAVRQERLFG